MPMDNQDMNLAFGNNDGLTPSQQVMRDFRKPLSSRTRDRHHKELDAFKVFMIKNGKILDNLVVDAKNWRDVDSRDVVDFLIYLRKSGYKLTSIRDKFYTIRTYARLAMQIGSFSTEAFKRLEEIKLGDILSEIDIKGQPSLSKKKMEPLLLTEEQVCRLLTQPDTFRGKSDALLMALFLQLGLWPREIAALNRRSLDLEKRTLTFYDYHFGEEQVCKLDDFTLKIAVSYLQELSPHEALFVGNRKESTTELRLTDRAINARVRTLGEQIGIYGLSPHDCHLYWERTYRQAAERQQESASASVAKKNDSLPNKPSFRQRGRPDLFNRRTFEIALLSQGIPDSLVSPIISDIRLLVPLLIQQVGEETFRKIAFEHRNTLVPGSGTEMWEQAIHHLVTWAKNEMERYFSKNGPDDTKGLLD